MIKKISVVLLLTILLLTFTSCNKAEKDQLVLYTWEGMFPREVLEGFTKQTGIEIIYSTFDLNETMLEKLSTANGASTYDLVIGDDYIIDAVIKRGLAQKLDKTQIPSFGNINPIYQGYFYDETNEYTVPYGAGIPMIVYNPDEIDFDIDSYQDLWDPRLKDSIAITANYRLVNGITLRSMGKGLNETDIPTIKAAGEKLLLLADNIRLVQDDNTQLSLLNGEAKVALLYTSQVTSVLAENPNLKAVFPSEGLGIGIMDFFIPKDAKNVKAAHRFLEYILQPQVAADCFNYLGYFCTTKVADDLVNPNLVFRGEFKGEIMQNVPEDADEQYNKNWIEFKTALN